MGSACDVHGNICKTCTTNCFFLHQNVDTNCPFDGGCDSCQASAALNLEIAHLEAKLAQVTQQRQSLKTKMNVHHDRLIHCFPFEITCQIFNHVVEDDGRHDNDSPAPRQIMGNPVLILGRVCRTWRNITLNIPELWSKVTIDLWKVGSLDCFKSLEEWVQRSGCTPLFFTIKSSSNPSAVDPDLVIGHALELVVPLLGSLSGRWSGFRFRGQCRIMCSLLNRLKHAPQVDILQITFPTGEFWSARMLPRPKMQTEFNPKSLFIATSALLLFVPLRWERLTRLDANRIAINELLLIVQAAAQLHTLHLATITRSNDLSEFPMPTQPIVSRSLVHLDTEKSTYVAILRHLTLPALQTLKHCFYRTGLDYQVFPDFVRRSGLQSLTHFSFVYQLDELSYPQSDQDCQYDNMPAVTHLHIGIPSSEVKTRQNILGIGERLLSPLRRRQAFPLLREISITAPILSTTSWSHLCDFLGHAQVDESPVTVVPHEKPLRPLERISVKLIEEGAFSKPDAIISERDSTRLIEVQRSGVDINLTVADRGDKSLDLVVLRDMMMRYDGD